jgi:hypothetical protein
MDDSLRAFDRRKHDAVKHLNHLAKEIFVSTDDIFNVRHKYGAKDHWKYIKNMFWEKHRVRVLDVEKLVLYTTLLDNTMKIVGHKGISISEPVE